MKISFVTCVSVLTLAAIQKVNAQESAPLQSDVRNVVTVTAQYREQSVLEVPLAITAYEGEFLEQIGVNAFDELSRFVPGLLVQEQSVNNPGFVLRGITSDNGASNIEPRVSVFQNGVSISRSSGSLVQLFDLERIEVLKGPQGTLFGRSSQIGAVHVITQRPTDAFEGYFKAETGNFEQQHYEGAINIPIVEDVAALRVAGTYESRDGFIDNNTGSDLNGTDSYALRGSFRIEPTDGLTIDLIGHYGKDTPPGVSFKSGVIPALGGSTDPNAFASLNTFGNFLDGQDLSVDRTLWDVALIADWQINDTVTITSTSAYREFDSLEIFDPDGTAFDIFIFGEGAESRQISSDIRFQIDNGGKLTGVFGSGVFYEEGSQTFDLGFDLGTTAALFSSLNAISRPNESVSLFGGSPSFADAFLTGDPAVLNAALQIAGIPSGVFQHERFTNYADNKSFDLFGELSYDVTAKLNVTVGGRFTFDDKETSYLGVIPQPNPMASSILFGSPTIFVGESGGIVSSDESDIGNTFSGFTWRGVLNYEIDNDKYAYFNYSRGRRPEVINDDPTNTAGVASIDFQTIDAETIDSYEIGFKGAFFDRRAVLETALFYYDYQNFQSLVQVSGPGEPLVLETINAGAADSVGVELGLSIAPTDELDLFFTYGLNRARFDDNDDQGNPQRFGGNRFRLSPDHSLSVGLHYEKKVGGINYFITPTYTWQSKIYFEDDNADSFTVIDPATNTKLYTVPSIGEDAYGLTNVRGGVTLNDGRVTLEAYVENLADHDYIIDAGNIGGNFNIPTYIPGPPRFFGGGVSVRF